MPDDEETLQEQEETEGTTDHTAEVAELQAEGEMTMEELLKKYSGAYDDDFEMPLSEEEEEEDEGEQEDEETEGKIGIPNLKIWECNKFQALVWMQTF